ATDGRRHSGGPRSPEDWDQIVEGRRQDDGEADEHQRRRPEHEKPLEKGGSDRIGVMKGGVVSPCGGAAFARRDMPSIKRRDDGDDEADRDDDEVGDDRRCEKERGYRLVDRHSTATIVRRAAGYNR